MTQTTASKRVLPCIHCKRDVPIPDFVKTHQIWVGTCAEGHKALYSCPAEPQTH